jgi:hypothetical protein
MPYEQDDDMELAGVGGAAVFWSVASCVVGFALALMFWWF